MQNSTSSSPSLHCRSFLVFLLLLLLLFLTSSATAARFSDHPVVLPAPSRNQYISVSCDSFLNKNSRSLCIQLQRIHQRRQPLPPPSNSPNQIDPRYGVEKRLVPSGPNPLHN
ncbi:Clavata3/ESR (CLE) [Melia azedarach]|uniref:Clavata3/ESR (CLE) n=1 Tax=Melia azedarach TaxID=155640 RepID=A0ACC1XJ15_MELAZ|nr:Clavata3/ESR (CLE) [Melia azedarach]